MLAKAEQTGSDGIDIYQEMAHSSAVIEHNVKVQSTDWAARWSRVKSWLRLSGSWKPEAGF